MKAPPDTPIPLIAKSPLLYLLEVVRPGGLELPTFWFVAIRVKMLNALFGVAYELGMSFFPHLAAPNLAPKTALYRDLYGTLHEFNPKSRVRLRHRDFEPPTS